MSQRSSGPAGPGGDDWPDELWPGADGPPGGGPDDDPPGGGPDGISGIKVGDHVSAQIVQNGGAARATAIQDPAQPLAGGTAP